jgi:hypothetical protein
VFGRERGSRSLHGGQLPALCCYPPASKSFGWPIQFLIGESGWASQRMEAR